MPPPLAGPLCGQCLRTLRPMGPPWCGRCCRPLRSGACCRDCRDKKSSLECLRAAFAYRRSIPYLLHAFKYRGRISAGKALAGWMAGMLPRFPEISGADAVVPVPLHPKRLRERGFNQASLLALETAAIYSKPVEEILQRTRDTLPQWRLTRSRRSENLREAFEVRCGARLDGKSFLLVDDVYTTGATLESCAQTLKAAGAARICAYVLARD